MDPVITFPMLGGVSFSFPSYFVLFGHAFYWYGVIIACGFLLAVWYCFSRCRQFGITQDDLLDTVLWGVPLGIVGARAYYVLFYGNYDTFWDMCKIWEGGLAIYGGVIAATITIFIVCRIKKISPFAMLDITAFGLLIGQAVGRWGNFANREAFGYETDIFCRMGLTYADGHTIYVHPCFLYESLWNAAGLLLLHLLSKKTRRLFDGQYFLSYLGWYGLGRVWIEGLRTDSMYIGSIRVSQLLAAVCVVAVAVIFLLKLKSGTCTPDRLFVNRVAAAEAAAAAKAGTDAPEDGGADPAEDDAAGEADIEVEIESLPEDDGE